MQFIKQQQLIIYIRIRQVSQALTVYKCFLWQLHSV